MNTRAFTAEDSAHLARLRELVVEAEGHHRAAVDAADKNDKAALTQSHIRVSRCFRSLHVRFAKIAGDAVLADIDANHKTQNSDGMGEGTSDSPRAVHPLMTGDVAGWVGRAFAGKAK
jgi:hypothetical protein